METRSTPKHKRSPASSMTLRSKRKCVEDDDSQEPESIEDKVKGLTFIQCENESCLKWRKISKEEADKYEGVSWYCRMNKKDPAHNRCEHPEEDQFVGLASNAGYQYTFSSLPCGTLVWAKMTGHVAWPALLTPDPEGNNDHVCKDGGSDFYHVEFLGYPHMHYWVHSLHLDPYGSGRKPALPDPKPRGGRRKPLLASKQHNLVRNKKYRLHFEEAMKEAEQLKKLSLKDRLKRSVFKPKKPSPKKKKKEAYEKEAIIPKDEIKEEVEVKRSVRVKREVVDSTDEGLSPSTPRRSLRNLGKQSESDTQPTPKRKPKVLSPKECKPKVKVECSKPKEKKAADHVKRTIKKVKAHLQKKRMKQRKLINSQLTKALRDEEKKFNKAWTEFMKRRKLPFDRKLSFDGKSLSAFHVFMTVQERGGYKQCSCSPEIWGDISCQLTGRSTPGEYHSVLIKQLYKRNLLPYEKHLLYGSVHNSVEPHPPLLAPSPPHPPVAPLQPTPTAPLPPPQQPPTTSINNHTVVPVPMNNLVNSNRPHQVTGSVYVTVTDRYVYNTNIYSEAPNLPMNHTPIYVPQPGGNTLPWLNGGSYCHPPLPTQLFPAQCAIQTSLPQEEKLCDVKPNKKKGKRKRKDGDIVDSKFTKAADGQRGDRASQVSTVNGVSSQGDWLSSHSLEMDKNMERIDSLMNDICQEPVLDRATLVHNNRVVRINQPAQPVLEFYSMQYDDLDTVLKEQRHKNNKPDDTQCVPDLSSKFFYSPNGARPVMSPGTSSAQDMAHLVNEVSRLDDALNMEFMQL